VSDMGPHLTPLAAFGLAQNLVQKMGAGQSSAVMMLTRRLFSSCWHCRGMTCLILAFHVPFGCTKAGSILRPRLPVSHLARRDAGVAYTLLLEAAVERPRACSAGLPLPLPDLM
jgi:hypothetical protein